MMQWHCVFIILAAARAVGLPSLAPDTSMRHLPVAYYGANWNRSDENIETLSKLQIVVLMQEDGPCWRKCCPTFGPGQCGPLHNASALPGCDSTCDQHGWQSSLFGRIKRTAQSAGRRPPHCMLYLNQVYDFPFDKTQMLGNDIHVLDIDGRPHVESIDPGLYPVSFFDLGRKAGQDAWLSIVQDNVVDGAADGVYVDCYGTLPFKCNDTTSKYCNARRNGQMASLNEVVSRDQVDAYKAGMNSTLWRASELVGPSGTFLARQGNVFKPPWFGGNMVWINPVNSTSKYIGRLIGPELLIQQVHASFQYYPYIVVGGINDFSDPRRSEALESKCDESTVAQFLLAWSLVLLFCATVGMRCMTVLWDGHLGWRSSIQQLRLGRAASSMARMHLGLKDKGQ